MPTEYQEFDVSGRTFRFRPWPSFRALTEWGKLGADIGESLLELFLVGGVGAVSALTQGGVVEIAQTAIEWLGAEDLGERVKHYLDSCEVDVRAEDGAWVPLHGAQADATAANEGVDGMTLLEVAWHCVREGLRPLFGRLASHAAGQATS